MSPGRKAVLLLLAGILAAFALRPLAHGVPASTVAAFWAATLGLAAVPGILLLYGARRHRGDPWLLIGQGTTVGLALHGLAFVAGRGLAAPWLPLAAAVAAAGIGLALGRGGPRAEGSPTPGFAGPALAVLLLAALVQPLFAVAELGEPIPADLLFHAGNAAELRHRWPLEDPRAAGLPLRYHLLAYALPIEAADRASAPVADTLLALAPLLWVLLLALQLSNAGRVLFGDGRVGVLGAALVLLHTDPGAALGLGASAFSSHLSTGVYGSPTTVGGLVLLAGLAIELGCWLQDGGRPALVTAAALAVAASATKASVLPAVIGGLGLAGGIAALRGRRCEARRGLQAAAALAAAGLPFSWILATGDTSYRGILRWAPGALFLQSPFTAAGRHWAGLTDGAPLGAWAIPLALVWIVGYLGFAGLGLSAWALLRREPVTAGQRWALAVAGVGMALALSLDAQGTSQLFFAYNGQVLLALFAGAGLLLTLRRGATARLLAPLLALALLPSLGAAGRLLRGAARADLAVAGRRPPAPVRDYRAGLEWLRVHASRDAVVFADNPSFLLSAIGEVRLYYENGLYTPRGWELRWAGQAEPFAERAALQERLLRRPGPEAVAAARRVVGAGPRILVVADSVPSRIDSGIVFATPAPLPPLRFFPEELFALRFANGALQVYEALER